MDNVIIFLFLLFEGYAGVSGGTASGKTTVCDMIIQQLHDHRVLLVNQVSHFQLLHLLTNLIKFKRFIKGLIAFCNNF